MATERDNPRAIREAQARYEYDLRNKGLEAATAGVFARNAARREAERRAAGEKIQAHVSDQVGKELARQEKNRQYFLPK